MSKMQKKQVCKCENCGNEAEMVITCTLPDADDASSAPETASDRVKGTGTCANCGNEAEMWIDI